MQVTRITDQVVGQYTGPAYPFRAGIRGVFGGRSDDEVVNTSIRNILTTPKGSVPYNPNIGSSLPKSLFEQNDPVTQSLIHYFVDKDLGEQEPRAGFEGATLSLSEDGHGIFLSVYKTPLSNAAGQPSANNKQSVNESPI